MGLVSDYLVKLENLYAPSWSASREESHDGSPRWIYRMIKLDAIETHIECQGSRCEHSMDMQNGPTQGHRDPHRVPMVSMEALDELPKYKQYFPSRPQALDEALDGDLDGEPI
ncbi:hypothetical protein LIER_21072 [Lithospermum erythrorhizon]|uniref:Uncharacterized protein n=1 Tax=Lithospermum erythrorhizon TaxID=34254 RepID=A0AAV3QRQ1_LITER